MGASTEEMPQSVEEAGALLGAAITRYGSPGAFNLISPPKGTHSSFSAISPVPSSELLICLHSLRALLRSAPKDTPLVAAPSLLAGVLMKLLGISNNLASSTNADPTRRTATPPMLSTPLRKLWVDCVVLCHTLGEGLSGNTRINIYGFVRNMISLASMNPRMAKAAGGTRVAAIEVIGALMEDEKLSKQLSSWALDVIHLSQRALKSSGTGGPTYRIASVRTASSAAIACREAFIKTRPLEGTARLVLKGALEDRAILDMVKLLRVATNDKFPEVRSAAATLASLLAPLVIHTHVKSSSSPDAAAASPTASLEDMMTIAIQNLDDKSPEVAAGWAEALARCMSTSIEFRKQASAEKASHRDASGAGDSPSKTPRQEQANRLARKGVVSASVCSTLPNTLKYLVKMYVKVGGELVAPRAGGSFSTGGRAVRVGFARTLTQLLRIQSSLNAIGEGRSISHKEAIKIILTMVGKDMETQLSSNDKSSATPFPESLDATSIITPTTVFDGASSTVFGQPASNPLFGVQGPKVSPADGGIVCLAASRVLRDGISNLALESTQIAILHELIGLCNQEPEALQANQLQVVLTEISHLFTALGEASATAIDDLLPALANCLRNPNHGVRYEAVVACAAMSSVFPSHGRQIVQDCICAIRLEHAELMALASTKKADGPPETGSAARRFRFGRVTPVKEVKVDESLKHQFAIHGMALMVSVVIRDLPNLPGGLPMEVLDTVILVAHVLVDTLFNNIVTAGNPSGACTCARAGFGLICGALAAGPRAVTKHIALIFDSWKKMSNPSPRNRKFSADHELMCVESMLSSVVVFLKNCSELLLSIPDALSKTSLVLEQLLPLFFKNGKFGNIPTNPIAASRLDSAKASLMEAFSWLPPGSYPMVADAVFSFAAGHIQNASQCDVPCSILGSLVSKEDMILDSMTFSRATLADEVGDARDLGNDIIARTAEPADYGDREAVSHFFGGSKKCRPSVSEFLGSQVLGMICDDRKEKPPTVLHEVGTWRTPVIPSCSSTIRLVDAAIQAFAATFGLKSGKEQQRAMQMLASLVPSASYLAEQEKRTQVCRLFCKT